ncbi:aa3-type cytochrome c oxidase subunit IV [Phenylobacterium soli]|uniref:Aa3-type cytochrome c oxidase subunit IV n=1 Tax=Phenylobacterium soli TaxID=2170551 RepID=A0A328AF66_9CAUL|nr:aa3-type cytochrome c oxidase subunit IV [Phenylobacterium soli]RAK53175.1 aa3-type cytochrome c oxidase subunit IV [Phenylobacterium soli]
MAGAASDYHRGDMDIAEQVSTFELFNALTKWGSLFVGALLLFLTLWFCTPAGFLGAAIATAVVVGLGVFLLRDKPEAAAAH